MPYMTAHHLFAAFKLLAGFATVAAYLTLKRKTQIQALTPIDVMGGLLIGGMAGSTVYHPDTAVLTYLVQLFAAIGIMMLLNRFLYPATRHRACDQALSVIINGKLQPHLLKAHTPFHLPDFMAQLRSRGIYSLREVDFAQIEADGTLTVIKHGEGRPNFLLAHKGQILAGQLKQIGRDPNWLIAALAEMGIELEDVFLAELANGNELYVVRNNAATAVNILD